MKLKLLLILLAVRSTYEACPDSDLRCQKCNARNFCEFCVYSYPDVNGVCQIPNIPVDGCYAYSRDGFCMECQLGTYKTPKGLCFPLTKKNKEHCVISFISASSCSHCRNGTLTLNGRCPSRRKCSDPKCDVCYMNGATEACYICASNFVLIGEDYGKAKCALRAGITEGCFFTTRPDFCLDCDFG